MSNPNHKAYIPKHFVPRAYWLERESNQMNTHCSGLGGGEVSCLQQYHLSCYIHLKKQSRKHLRGQLEHEIEANAGEAHLNFRCLFELLHWRQANMKKNSSWDDRS